MAKILEISKDRDANRFGNITMRVKVELSGEVFVFNHSYPDEYTQVVDRGRAQDFEDYLRAEARKQIGKAVMDKFFPNL